MCGVYGFQQKDGPPDPAILLRLAALADQRGSHAHGVATSTTVDKVLGRHTKALVQPAQSQMIGHARLATVGAYGDLACAQPLRADGWIIAHNGTVPQHHQLAQQRGLTLYTTVDSEVLALLLATATTAHEIAARLNDATAGAPLALLALHEDGRFLAARRGHPLHVLERSEGRYFCSLSFGQSLSVLDASVTLYTARSHTSLPLASLSPFKSQSGGPQWQMT